MNAIPTPKTDLLSTGPALANKARRSRSQVVREFLATSVAYLKQSCTDCLTPTGQQLKCS